MKLELKALGLATFLLVADGCRPTPDLATDEEREPQPAETAPAEAGTFAEVNGTRLFYEIRGQGRDGGSPTVVAANVDLAESDLTPMDPHEVAAGAMGRANGAAPPGANASMTALERERNQRLWWFLLFGGLALLALETVFANRIESRTL